MKRRMYERIRGDNPYSLLTTIEGAFGLGCLQYTCDTDKVVPMAPLFAIS